MGFRLMLAMADTVVLCTGPEGTQLMLTVRNRNAAEEQGDKSAEEAGGDGQLEWAA